MSNASSLTLLHLSDIQFGRNHRFGRLGSADPEERIDSLLERLARDLRRLEKQDGLRPDVVVLSGDLAEWGRAKEFDDVFDFTVGLLERLKLDRDRVVLVPGNHDISRNLCQAYFLQCEDEPPKEPFVPKWDHFARFFKKLYEPTPTYSFHPDTPWTLFQIEPLRLVVAGLNSTWKESHREGDHYGWINEAQLRWFEQQLEDFKRRRWFRLGVVHHNVRGDAEDDENLRNASLLEQILGESLNLLLHGHTHEAKVHWVHPRLPVLSTGSAAVRLEARAPEVPNQYQVIRLTAEGFERHCRQFDARAGEWMADPRHDRKRKSGKTKQTVDWDLTTGSFPEQRADEGRQTRRDRLLERVLRVCALRQPGCSGEIVPLSVPRIEYLRVTARESSIVRVRPIGVLERGVDRDWLRAFSEHVVSQYRTTEPGLIAEVVHGGEPSTPEDQAEAARLFVRLRSFVEYQGIWDARRYLARQTERLRADTIYDPEMYIPQRASVEDPHGDPVALDVLARVEEWAKSDNGRFILLLGEFGTGKTFLLHQLAMRLAQPESSIVPVLIEMRALEKGRSLDELVAQHLARAGEEAIALRAFRYMLEEGRIALLFDGYDELALRVSYDRAVEHFDSLLQAYKGSAKIVVTSRTQHFESEKQIKTALLQKLELLGGLRVGRLRRFEDDQVLAFLGKRMKSDAEAQARFELIRDVRDLHGLAANPRMLGFIADLPESEFLAAKGQDERIDSSKLYHKLVERWLKFEVARVSPTGSDPGLTLEQCWKAVTSLALLLWQKVDQSVRLADLTEDVGKTMQAFAGLTRVRDRDQDAHTVGSGTLLVRDDEGNFAFLHQSVMEWLVARELGKALESEDAGRLLAVREVSALMTDFLISEAGRDASRAWAERVIAGEASEVTKKNANLVAKQLGEPVHVVADYSGKDLRNQDLSGRDLRRARMRGADLTDARLVGTDLRDADLDAAVLERADLRNSKLDRAVLTHARLDEANLGRTSLLGARLDDAVLWRSKLVGARLHREALARVLDFGSALDLAGGVRLELSAQSPCQAVAWSGDGRLLASGHSDGSVRLWELASGKELRVLAGHQDWVRSVAFSPDGTRLASGSSDKCVRLWAPASGKELRVLAGHEGGVNSVAFSPDGTRVASGSSDKSVRLWELGSGKEQRVLARHQSGVNSVAFSPDGTRLASGSSDRSVRLWELASGKELRALAGLEGEVRSVAFSPDGTRLASGSYERSLRLWELASGKELHALAGHEGEVNSVAISPDGTRLASGSSDKSVRLWELASGKELLVLARHEGWVRSVAFSPDGTRLASGSSDKSVRLWELASGKELRALAGHQGGVRSVAYSPDGARLASGSDDMSARLWELASGKELRVLAGHEGWVNSVAFSPDGTRLASGSSDHSVRLWELKSGKAARIDSLRGPVTTIAFHPRGRLLAAACADGSISILDTREGRWLYSLAHLPDGWVAFTPEGEFKCGGEFRGSFWHVINLCRYEPGELDEVSDRRFRLPDDHVFLESELLGSR
jgi:WD40 repeat protein/3',5'-cyclic AMP phosphodiesterase CpdA